MESRTNPRLTVVQRLSDDDAEDAMRAADLLVHVGGRHRPRLVPLRHQHLNVLERVKSRGLFLPTGHSVLLKRLDRIV